MNAPINHIHSAVTETSPRSMPTPLLPMSCAHVLLPPDPQPIRQASRRSLKRGPKATQSLQGRLPMVRSVLRPAALLPIAPGANAETKPQLAILWAAALVAAAGRAPIECASETSG